MTFPHYHQPDTMDCGPTCLRIIAKHYGRSISLEKLRSLSDTTRSGSSLQGIADAAEKIGFRSLGVKIDFKALSEQAPLPCIVFWRQSKRLKNKLFQSRRFYFKILSKSVIFYPTFST